MWVVKLGGSVSRDALLPQWLALLADAGPGVVVPGGGGFADCARAAQSHWRLPDLAGHNMAVLGMAQTAVLLQALCPALQCADDEHALRRVLHAGGTALWLAERVGADRLLLVKSCAIDPAFTLAQWGEAGVVDAEFAARAGAAGLPVTLLHKGELARARALLAPSPAGGRGRG